MPEIRLALTYRRGMVPRRLLPAALLALVTLVSACGGGGKHVAAPPTETPTPTPTPTKAAVLCPLTGAPATPEQNVNRVALAVKIDNIDLARPQAGIDKADFVVEELVEGGLTRLFAVFQCDTAPLVGPIRSARTSDGDLLALLHGSVFAYSGANPRAMPAVRAHGNAVLIPFDNLPQYFHRSPSRPAPHDVFSDTKTLLNAGLARRKGLVAPKPLFLYGDVSAAATPATTASMRWPAASAGWRWNGTSWLRNQNRTPDVLTNQVRVKADNVVIMQIRIGSTGIRDVAGNPSPLDITTGAGKVWVLRDGKVVAGTWRRPTIAAPLRFYDVTGAPILLHPGRTWVELLPVPRVPKLS
jgi:hypothetical protein